MIWTIGHRNAQCPPSYESYFNAFFHEITGGLERDHCPVDVDSVLQSVADEVFEDNDEAMSVADDAFNLMDKRPAPRFRFSYNEHPNPTPLISMGSTTGV